MTRSLEYHVGMRPTMSASVAFFVLIAISLCFVPKSDAQINGTPTSVTSPGFGGRAINGTAASVTSLGPHGFAPGPQIPVASGANGFRRGDGHHRRRHDHDTPFLYALPVPYAVAVPYSGDSAEDDDSDVVEDADYQGGPTVFDRRGSGERSYVPPMKNPPAAHRAVANDDPPADPEPAQAPTLLVFKDGHKLEVGNYAIIGGTLFDLTPGHARRIALAELDLDATRHQNDQRGVTFQLPSAEQVN